MVLVKYIQYLIGNYMNCSIKRPLLVILSLLISYSSFAANCLHISDFDGLASFSDFDPDTGYVLSNEIRTPSDLTVIHNERIKTAEQIDGISFLTDTSFDDGGTLTWDTFTVNGTNKKYDIYLYEAGDNGNGFIFAHGDSSKVIAEIAEKEIYGCIEY